MMNILLYLMQWFDIRFKPRTVVVVKRYTYRKRKEKRFLSLEGVTFLSDGTWTERGSYLEWLDHAQQTLPVDWKSHI